MWLVAILACESPGEPGSLALGRNPDLVASITLPDSSRDGPTPETLPLGPWTQARAADGIVEWVAPLDIAYIDYGHSSRRAPKGLEIEGPTSAYYARLGDDELRVNTWDTRSGLRLRLAEDAGPPEGWTVAYARATSRDRRMNRVSAELSDWAFVTSPVQPERDSMRGLFLPAPAQMTWSVQVPKDGRLVFDAEILKAPWGEGVSDGADVIVSVDGVDISTQRLAPDDQVRLTLELGEWGGQTVALGVRTEPGATALEDYVFLGDPTLFTPRDEPRVVVLVFVDTLRADALGTYGGSPETSPTLDAWAQTGVVFEQARSPAPWTVPSTRTALSGRQPDLWDPETSLPSRLAAEGFRTEAFISNAFLDTPFGQGSSWSRYTYQYLASAEVQVDRALAALSVRTGRDRLVMVHFMDPHVPYREPEPYASMWVGERPAGLEGGMGRAEVGRLSSADRKAAMPYLEGRYRQNVRYVDDQLARLFEGLPDDAIVLLFSDHGEEFGEHGGFEHGHTLYDELLHVPLILKAPGVPAGRVDAPVGLIDIAPTVLDLLDLPAGGMDGDSLVPAASGDAAALAALADRPMGAGYTLYKTDAWALIDGRTKWVLREGRERVYDLASDPGEEDGRRPDVDESVAMSERLSQALGREVRPAWRVAGYGNNKHSPGRAGLEVRHPDGIEATWKAYDPLDTLAEPTLVDGVAAVDGSEKLTPREWYVLPTGDATQVQGLTLGRPGAEPVTYKGDSPMPIEGRARSALTIGVGTTRVSIMPVWTPAPVRSKTTQVAPEREAELRALGYLE